MTEKSWFVGDYMIISTNLEKDAPGEDHEYGGGYRDGVLSTLSALHKNVSKGQLNIAFVSAIGRFEEKRVSATKKININSKKISSLDDEKALEDILNCLIEAKAHFDTHSALIDEDAFKFGLALTNHNEFFATITSALFNSYIICLAKLFDNSYNSSSLVNYAKICKTINENQRLRITELSKLAKPILILRNKLIAHTDLNLSTKEIFLNAGISLNDIKYLINESASIILNIKDRKDFGDIGIPDDGRLKKEVLDVLKSLN